MSEIAMVSSRKSRLESEAKKGNTAAKKALELSKNPGKFLSTVQIGITLIGIFTGIYSGEKLEADLVLVLNNFEVLQPYSKTLAVTIIVISLTFFSLVLGELVPKRIGLSRPERVSKLLAFPMYWISLITAPFIWLLTITSDIIIRIFSLNSKGENQVTEEEIKAIIQEGASGGAIEEIEQDIVERVFGLGDRRVSSLMTHRRDLEILKLDYSNSKIREIVNIEIHSAYPVLDEKEDAMGMVYLKDLFRLLEHENFQLKECIKQPLYVSENQFAFETLKLFKREKQHQALVIDEFGQVQGIITMNDVLEALVGDASEFYSEEYSFIEREDGSWLIDGKYPLADFLRKIELEELIPEYTFNTISGLIIHATNQMPKVGEFIEWRNYRLEVIDMDGARIDKVLISKL